MAYSRTTWVDGTTPALNATNLNNIEQGIVTLDTEKAPKASPTFTGTVTLPSTTSVGNVSSTEIGYLDGVTSAIQTQLNDKAPLANPTFTGTVNAATLDLTTAATSTAATAYFVETGSDGVVRPKSLANVKTEVVTTAAVNSAAATTLGTVTTGVWGATAIADGKIASALTGKTYNGLSLTAAATGFTIAGGTASKTLTISNTLTLSGTDSSTLNIGSGGTLGSAAFTASTAYAPAAGSSSITTVGTISSGTWQGSVIGATYIDSAIARLASPSFTTPTLGIASATSINKVAITAPATSATLTIANGGTLATSGAYSITFTATGTTTLTLPTSGTLAVTGHTHAIGDVTGLQTALDAKAPLANPTFTGTVNAATLDLTTAVTSTAASHYWVATGSDGIVRPKTLANVKTEVVTTAAVNTAAATTLGTVTTGVWNATAINATYIDSAIARLASPTFTGKVTTAATSASTAGLILPPGTAPSSPVDGDVWTTTAGVYYRNGTTTQHVPRVTVASSAPASPVDGDIWVDSDPAWTDWTPSVSASTPPTVTGTAGRYARYDNIVVGWGIFSITYANRGSGGYLLSLPVAPKQRTDYPRIGFAQVGQNSQYIHMQLELCPTSNYVQLLGAPTTTWGSLKFISATDITSPNTLSVSYNFVYEAA